MTIIRFLTIVLSLSAISVAAFVSQPEQDGVVSGTLPLITNAQNQLIGNISIGYPPQSLTVLFNISASNLIIYGSDLTMNPSISIASGPSNGFLATSSVAIAGLNITGQQFVLTLGSSPYPSVSGVFGLGYTEADINKIPSPLYNIIAQNLITVKLFSIQLPLMGSSNPASELYLGNIDTNLNFTKWVYPDSINASDWQFNVTTNYINGTAVSNNSTTYLSTTSSNMAVPDAIFTTLQKYLDIQPNANGDYMLPCDTIEPIFTFYLNNTNLTLLANDFMMLANDSQDTSTPICVFNIQNSGSDVWILGTPFLAKYNTVFHVGDNTIGFSQYTYEETTTTMPATSSITTPEPPATTTEGNAAVDLLARMMYQKLLCVFFILLILR